MMKEFLIHKLKEIYLTAWDASARLQEKFESPTEVDNIDDLNIAFVKQSSFVDYYANPNAPTKREIIFSSNKCSGPVPLLTKLDADYYIVKLEPDPECRVWEEKLRLREVPSHHPGLREEQDKVAIKSDDVDWSKYDMVYAVENAVPARITRRYPRVLWATMLEDHRMTQFKAYMKRPPEGYDCVFNEHFGPTPRSWMRNSHVIEWPYSLGYAQSIKQLFPDIIKENIVLVEGSHKREKFGDLMINKKFTVDFAVGRNMKDHLELLVRSKIFFSPLFALPRWGNALIEAAGADCVVVGNRANFWNPCMIDPAMHCTSIKRGIEIVEKLIFDDTYFNDVLATQRKRLNWYAYHRPFMQLMEYVRRSERPLTAKKIL